MTQNTPSSGSMFDRLSKEARAYLASEDVYRKYQRISEQAGIEQSKRPILSALFLRAILGIDTYETLDRTLGEFFGLKPYQVLQLKQQVGSTVLHPIADSVDGLASELKAWGTPTRAKPPSSSKSKTLEHAVREFVASSPEQLDDRIVHRLESALLSFARGKSTRLQTVERLSHPEKTGGVGLEHEEIEAMLARLEVVIMPFKKTKVPDRKISLAPPRVSAPTPKPTPIPARASTITPPDSVEALVSTICTDARFQFSDERLTNRCRKIVESRVREVRDAEHTRAQFEKSVDTGGLGLSGRPLAQIMEALEKRVDVYQKSFVDKTPKPRSAFSQRMKLRGQDSKKKQEQIERRYEDLTARVKKVSAPLSSDGDSIPPVHGSAARPQMKDVQFARKLVGPIEELGRLSLTAFRRFSKDPSVAADQVLSTVDLLEDQGYDQKVRGVSAWRVSPLNKQYLALSQEALLNGQQIKDVIEQKTRPDEQTMTIEEFMAIMKLNARLRF